MADNSVAPLVIDGVLIVDEKVYDVQFSGHIPDYEGLEFTRQQRYHIQGRLVRALADKVSHIVVSTLVC